MLPKQNHGFDTQKERNNGSTIKKQVANNSFKVLEPDYARLFDWEDAAVKTNFLNNDIL